MKMILTIIILIQYIHSFSQFDADFHVKALNQLSGGSVGHGGYFQLIGSDKMRIVLSDGNGESNYHATFLMKDLSAIGCFSYGVVGIIHFYAKTNKKFAIGTNDKIDSTIKFSMTVNGTKNANYIFLRLKKLYETLSIPFPTENNPWLKNDNAAAKLEIIEKNKVDISLFGIDTVINGKYILKFPNGKIRSERNLKNGICDGRQLDYIENGTLIIESNYRNGIKNGDFKYYYSYNGQLYMKESYTNGKPNGTFEYYNNGKKHMEIFYENGVSKFCKMYDEKGNEVKPVPKNN